MANCDLCLKPVRIMIPVAERYQTYGIREVCRKCNECLSDTIVGERQHLEESLTNKVKLWMTQKRDIARRAKKERV